MLPTSPLILASSSPYRRQLLQKLKLDFSCESPDIDESGLSDEIPEQLVERLALKKATVIANRYHDQRRLIIGSDQVAVLGSRILTKPGNHTNALQQLQHCSGKTVTFLTGLCLYNSLNNTCQQSIEHYSVTFRQLTDKQIEQYLLADQPYDCAGSFKAEGLGICLFEHMHGDDPNTLTGLPLIRLVSFLQQEGIAVPSSARTPPY